MRRQARTIILACSIHNTTHVIFICTKHAWCHCQSQYRRLPPAHTKRPAFLRWWRPITGHTTVWRCRGGQWLHSCISNVFFTTSHLLMVSGWVCGRRLTRRHQGCIGASKKRRNRFLQHQKKGKKKAKAIDTSVLLYHPRGHTCRTCTATLRLLVAFSLPLEGAALLAATKLAGVELL